MKNLLGIICSFLIYITPTLAQQQNWEQRKNLKDSIYHLVNEYKLSASFRDLDRTGISEKKIQQFRNLFETNASLINDIYPVNLKEVQKPKYPYQLTEVNLATYIETIKKTFPEGLNLNFRSANIDYSETSNGKIKIFIDREIRGKSVEGYQFQNRDTIVLNINVKPDLRNLKIASVSLIGKGTNLMCNICDCDKDGIPDRTDPRPCEVDDVRNKFFISLSADYMLNNPEVASLQTSLLGYEALLNERTVLGNIKHTLFPGMNFNFSIALDYFLNKNKRIGVSLGLGYNLITYNILLDTLHVEYKSFQMDKKYIYRQLISSNHTGEWVQGQYVSLPLLLKFHSNPEKKLGYFVHVGPTFNLLISGKSHAQTFVVYDAIRSYKDASGAKIDEAITNEIAEEVGYSISEYSQIKTIDTFKQNIGIFGNLKVGIVFKLNRKVSLLVGANGAFGKIPNQTQNKYQQIDQNGEYTTLVSASDNVQILSYGISTGLSIGIGKK